MLPVFQSIRENESLGRGGMGFLHPITADTVTLSAHGCTSHSFSVKLQSRKFSAPARLQPPPSGYFSLPRVAVSVC